MIPCHLSFLSLTGCNPMNTAYAKPDNTVADWLLKFVRHSFGAACYSTYGCKVRYNMAASERAPHPLHGPAGGVPEHVSLLIFRMTGQYRAWAALDQAGLFEVPFEPMLVLGSSRRRTSAMSGSANRPIRAKTAFPRLRNAHRQRQHFQ